MPPSKVEVLATFRQISTVGSRTDTVDNTTTPRQFLKIQFLNKGIDMLNLPQLVHSKRVTRTIPNCVLNDRPPVISYKYPQTISRKILNHRKTVKDINFDLGSSSMTCSCCDSGF